MAPVGGKPFLAYLIEQLRQAGLTKVVLSVGHFAGEVVGPPQCRAC